MNDDVRQGRTQQNDEHDVADTSHDAATANIVVGERGKYAATWMRGSHGLASLVRVIRGRLKPKDLEKVAQGIADRVKKVVVRRGTCRNTQTCGHNNHLKYCFWNVAGRLKQFSEGWEGSPERTTAR